MERKIDHALLRAYNNPSVLDLIRRIDPVVENIVVAINSAKDRIGTSDLLRSSRVSRKITSIPLPDYGWSRALNAGLRASVPRDSHSTILMLSNEVEPTVEQLVEMQEQALRGSSFGLSCHTLFSCGCYALFKDRNEPTYLSPRNTCILWQRAAIDGFLFNERLDTKQGMEDVYIGLQIYEEKGLLPSLGPVDMVVRVREGVDLEEKTRKELTTIKEYLSEFRPESVEAYFRAINVLNLSKGRGGVPLVCREEMS